MRDVDQRPGVWWTRGTNIVLFSILAFAIVSLVVLFVSIHQNRRVVPKRVAPPFGLAPSTILARSPKFDVGSIFTARVEPVLRRLQDKNDEACRRAISIIHLHFDHARNGAPAFADAIIGPLDSVKTTWLAGKGVFERWWHSNPGIQPVADHVRWNYEQNVTSGSKIKSAILDSIQQLSLDFRANRNEAIQQIGVNLNSADLPVAIKINPTELDRFCAAEFDAAMASVNSEHTAEDAAVKSAATFAFSSAAMMLTERAIVIGLGDYVTAAGGATLVGAAGGGAAGSAEPGGGTIIGATVGLLVGVGVDAWMSHENKARVITEVDKSLAQIEAAIITGDADHAGADKIFHDASSLQTKELRAKLWETLRGASQ